MKRFQKPNFNLDYSKKYEIYELDDDMNVVKIQSFGIRDGHSASSILQSWYRKMPHRSPHAVEVKQQNNQNK
jgi:hypothetical protein